MGIISTTMAKKTLTTGKDVGKAKDKKGMLPGAKKTGGKAKKKSWTKVKVKDKLNNEVFLSKQRYDKLCNEIPKVLCVTRAILCEKFKINGSVARALIRDLHEQGKLEAVGPQHSKFNLMRGTQSKTPAEKAAEEAAAEAKKSKK